MSSIDDRLLGDLLALERDYDELPPGAEARMLGAIASVLEGGGGDGGDGDGGGDGSGGAGASGAASASASAGGSALGATARSMTWLARAAWLGAGVVAGASGHAVIADKSPPTMPPAPSVAFVAPAPPVSVATPTASAATIAIDDLPSARPTSTTPAPKSSARIGEERSDLDVARAALARGRVDACLEAIDRHARTYGEGHFAEEREVLAVQALMAAGRRDEAVVRAARFRAKYPNSLFNPALVKATEKKEPSP